MQLIWSISPAMNTRLQITVEMHICSKLLPAQIAGAYIKMRVDLLDGGKFELDAYDGENGIGCCISTSRHKTRSGKHGSAKAQKVRGDMY
jgi:hypothetical protein